MLSSLKNVDKLLSCESKKVQDCYSSRHTVALKKREVVVRSDTTLLTEIAISISKTDLFKIHNIVLIMCTKARFKSAWNRVQFGSKETNKDVLNELSTKYSADAQMILSLLHASKSMRRAEQKKVH